ncbi:undecaprenyl-diphosphatase [Paenibacillus sp. VCA1]|uniref:Undecaprenyl-diphosphatase n=1 Tax=Paenibacillus albilobatus TaxID=2716884 RepID=A0A920CCC5_9BACL|nr:MULTISPECIES: undecaprenyl-diphosphatase [Paenibacillus]MDR9856939.1 undecaprenyl-diphosphatase [Paenibacillus sp. VCA1]GIO31422.1 undecaprenyl-diphosphatase [Paenibacillus albilobatus]
MLLSWDYSLFSWINDAAGSHPAIDAIMRFLSKDAEYLFYLAVIVYCFTRKGKDRGMVVQALVSACLAFGIGFVLSHLFYRDRPFVTHHVHQMIEHAANASFPSDHSIGSFVIAFSIFLCRKKDGVFWLILAVLIGFSRIWNGVHYPTDVISGAIIGIVSALVVYKLFDKLVWRKRSRSRSSRPFPGDYSR